MLITDYLATKMQDLLRHPDPDARLLAEDWHKVNDAGHESQSQVFGRAAHAIGAEALLVPSARAAGHFPARQHSSEHLLVPPPASKTGP
jgi:hypothetical protein